MIDQLAAHRFLAASRSRFVRIALEWLTTWEDPVDVLFALSGDVGQAFGPWDTFRYCALLGLAPAKAVRELGLDVLAEPVEAPRFAPVSEAFALAHARATWPEEAAPWAASTLAALRERPCGTAHPAALAAAALALVSVDPSSPEDEVDAAGHALEVACGRDPEEASSAAAEVLEGAALAGRRLPAAAADAVARLARAAQRDDGGLAAASEARLLRELATLRALGALRRGGPAST